MDQPENRLSCHLMVNQQNFRISRRPKRVCVRSDCSAGGGIELLMPIIVNGHYGASDGYEEGQQATVLV